MSRPSKRTLEQRAERARSAPSNPPPREPQPEPDKLGPPTFFDAQGHLVPMPEARLGLPPGTRDENTIKAAYREFLLDHRPESEPDAAREARDARDRLLDPTRVLERELAVLRVPDAKAWGLQPQVSTQQPRLDARTRLLGQALLYVLLDEATGTKKR